MHVYHECDRHTGVIVREDEDVWINFRTSVSGRRKFIAQGERSEPTGLESEAIRLFEQYELYRKAGFSAGRDRYFTLYCDTLQRITS